VSYERNSAPISPLYAVKGPLADCRAKCGGELPVATNPVCGTNKDCPLTGGCTWTNACLARCANVTITSNGTCSSGGPPVPQLMVTPCSCWRDYVPVCGFFPNDLCKNPAGCFSYNECLVKCYVGTVKGNACLSQGQQTAGRKMLKVV